MMQRNKMIRRGNPFRLGVALLVLYGLLPLAACRHQEGYTGDAEVGIEVDAFKNLGGVGKWKEIDTSDGPSGRRWHVAATWRQRYMLIHGGCSSGDESKDDLWIFDGSLMNWYKLEPTGKKPSKRCRHGGAIDQINDNLFIFGGQEHPEGKTYGDAYLLDLKPLLKHSDNASCSSSDDVDESKLKTATLTWQKIEPTSTEVPGSRYGVSCVFHDNLAVLLGGNTGSESMWQAVINSSSSTAEWKPCCGSSSPLQGLSLLLAKKEVLDKNAMSSNIISRAEHKRSLQPTVGRCSRWDELSLISFGGLSPSHAFISDRVEKFVVNSQDEKGFISGSWNELSVQDIEVKRAYMGAIISDYSLVVFGGFSKATDRFGRQLGLAFSDLLIYVGSRDNLQNVWYKLDEGGDGSSPSARFGQSLVRLDLPDRPPIAVMFGGYFNHAFSDAWQIELSDLSVSQVEESDSTPAEAGSSRLINVDYVRCCVSSMWILLCVTTIISNFARTVF